ATPRSKIELRKSCSELTGFMGFSLVNLVGVAQSYRDGPGSYPLEVGASPLVRGSRSCDGATARRAARDLAADGAIRPRGVGMEWHVHQPGTLHVGGHAGLAATQVSRDRDRSTGARHVAR